MPEDLHDFCIKLYNSQVDLSFQNEDAGKIGKVQLENTLQRASRYFLKKVILYKLFA